MFIKFVLFLFIAGFLFRVVLRYIMPVVQVSKMAHRQMSDMKKRMEEMQQQQQNATQQKQQPPKESQIEGEYIDYEEIK